MSENSLFESIKTLLPSGRKIGMGFVALLFVILAMCSSAIIETKEPDEILVIQSITDGKLTWYKGTESWALQLFGTATHYRKRSAFAFDAWEEATDPKQKGKCLNGIEIRFNDGGHGTVCGSVQYELPMDDEHLDMIHTKFRGQDAVQSALIETITQKAVYMAGPLMSSRESYAEKRNSLLAYIEDQIQNGVYKTIQRDAHAKDPITGADKTITVVEIVMGKDGHPEREQISALMQFGIKAFNFTIKRLPYDDTVENQIKEQQKITMDVQTAIAGAKKAEQQALTAVEQGKADAAKAKWTQEALKATAVTAAEQARDVAKLNRDAAEFYKQEQILKGEGDAAYRRKVMEANGALEQKLATFEKVMGKFAEEFGKQKWVPEVQMGGSGSMGINSAQTMMDTMSVKALRDLSLDMSMSNRGRSVAVSPDSPPVKRGKNQK